MYEFIKGPLVWISFIVFIGGSLYQLISMLKLAKKDKIIYPYMSLKFSLRSLIHWLTPFATTNMRKQPEMTIMTFAFHISLVLMPIFLLPHNILIERAWGISWWTLPKGIADVMTLIVIFAAIVFFIRRISNPVVKFVTVPSDYLLLVIAVVPFITGFLAYHHLLPYKPMSMLHMLSGEIMLMAIPFTRLVHMLYFAFTRAYMGSEFGAVRNAKDW
ncbi:MAG: nitrate reductase [Pseudomonadota bacterium]